MGCRYGSVVTDSACLPPGHYPEAAGREEEPRLPAQPCLQPQRSPTEVSHLGGGGSVLEVFRRIHSSTWISPGALTEAAFAGSYAHLTTYLLHTAVFLENIIKILYNKKSFVQN